VSKDKKSAAGKDPYSKREAEHYANPVASREHLLKIIKKNKKPLKLAEILEQLNLTDEDAIIGIGRRLKAMVRDGQLQLLPRKRFWIIDETVTFQGTVVVDKALGLAVRTANAAKIGILNVQDVVPGNVVKIEVAKILLEENDVRGRVVEVLDNSTQCTTGRFVKEQEHAYVIPFGRDFQENILVQANLVEAKSEDIVVVELVESLRGREFFGRVVEVLGDDSTRDIHITTAIHQYAIPSTWPAKVLEQAAKLNETISNNLVSTRIDLRALPLITIDGEDARDFDDAVYCETVSSGGFRLYVAIADVSYYVKPDSAIDKEALNRGNSTYFPSKVIPMLPEKLSNGLCSLLPETDRLCMVCEIKVSKTGKLTRSKFYEAVMHSKARMTYNQVAKLLEPDNLEVTKPAAAVMQNIHNLHNLYQLLAQERTERGAIEFDTVETRIIYGKNNQITEIVPIERNVAHKIIEECMLLANVATANFLRKNKVVGVFRNHDGVKEEKLAGLKLFLHEQGISFPNKKTFTPKDYSKIIQKIRQRDDYRIIQMVLLRSLNQATYGVENIGHFGLAYEAYTHFTSPIRRYPDLLVHRQIKKILHPKKFAEIKYEDMEQILMHCSMTERRSDDATRDVTSALKCRYIANHIGEVFAGTITGVTNFGLFVELNDYYVDGLVHIASLHDDYYIFDVAKQQLIAEKGNNYYSLGMAVVVQVVRVNVDDRKIDLELVQARKQQKRTAKTAKNRTKPEGRNLPAKSGKFGSTKEKPKTNNRDKKST